MKPRIHIFCFLMFLLATPAPGQINSDSHTVTVRVQEITSLELDIGAVMMTMTGTGLVAGQNTMTVSDQSSTLRWGTNAANIKTTVMSAIVAPKFILKIEAINATEGTPTGEIVLSGSPADLLVDLGMSTGNCRILYTGVAAASQGIGVDNHIITFTVQAQ